MKLALPAIESMGAADIRTLRQGGTVTLNLNGQAVQLELEDIFVQRQEKEGMTVANEADITVALDTRLNAQLIQEGWAREVVSRLQNLRKEMQLDVTDRIHVHYLGPQEMQEAIQAQQAYIANETLALSLTEGDDGQMHEVEVNGVQAKFSVCKA
jgi:isoleucyl-tRNA synthetase